MDKINDILNMLYNFFAKYPLLLFMFSVFMVALIFKLFKKVMREEFDMYWSPSILFSDLGEMLACILPGVLISIVIAFMISF